MSINNSVRLNGRLTADPELKYVGENPVTNFKLAVNRSFKNKEGKYDADFIPCVAWGKTAEIISKWLKKGKVALVEGPLQTRTYEKDGQTHYVTEVRVESVEPFLCNPKNGNGTVEKKEEGLRAKNNEAEFTQEEIDLDSVPF